MLRTWSRIGIVVAGVLVVGWGMHAPDASNPAGGRGAVGAGGRGPAPAWQTGGQRTYPAAAERFKTFNEIYKRYFPKNPPARIFFCVPEWTGPFDIEIDCVAVTKS